MPIVLQRIDNPASKCIILFKTGGLMRTSAFGQLQLFLGPPVLVGCLVLLKSQSKSSCGLCKFV